MKNIVIYQHAGSQNHGCEALVRTIVSTLRSASNDLDISLASFEIEEDKRYGINQIVDRFYPHSIQIKRFNINWFKIQLAKLFHLDTMQENILTNFEWLDKRYSCDCYVAIGGDNYCYDEGKTFYPYDRKIQFLDRKKILLGCSIEPSNLKEELIDNLKSFELITARETITYNALKKIKGLKRVELVPDTAFTLPTIKLSLPKGFKEGNTVGINVSPLIMEYEEVENSTFKNYCALVKYIIEKTEYQIALIPHVVWKSSDDRVVLKKLYDLFLDTGRVVLVEDCNCMELKGYISRCELFIGARTHATIAAYSSCVPTLVVGYSVKARGIANDLFGTSERYVLPVQTLKNETDLIDAFDWLDGNKEKIRKHLKKIMPEYMDKVSNLGAIVGEVLE